MKKHSLAVVVLLVISSLMASTAITRAQAVTYEFFNNAIGTAGSTRFENGIGVSYSLDTLDTASTFIWQIFGQAAGDRKDDVQRVRLYVDDMDGVAYTINADIHVSAKYVGNYAGDVRREIGGVLYHEATHVWQWNGRGNAPGGLIEGIADFVRLKAGYAPSHWVGAGGGDRWDQGYDVTARFLDYLDGIKAGFVADLNRKMKDGYTENFFVELMGKSVNQLWSDYKSQFGGSN
ncbi:hypothetical protein H6P81_017636 [Aristolochia fimbriata]|uniref:Uncharacterized protein n=1 Tax=Aristolochia fimbriata TaxID=158543 RepID=A0AAV7E1S1_ARIFI|nr:hypothetical protein H6P81_017636 [Aristolochia fimbriata]